MQLAAEFQASEHYNHYSHRVDQLGRRVLFLQAGIYEYRLIEAMREVHIGIGPDRLAVACPKCGLSFFADPLSFISPLDRSAMASAVAARLEEGKSEAAGMLRSECPDHPHQFRAGI